MPCYHPVLAYRAKEKNQNGKWPLVFNPRDGYVDLTVKLPCGQCVGCRIERSRQWAVRCVHESKLHENNAFITLTYQDERLPWLNGKPTLLKRDFTLFMKRLRKQLDPIKIRYFMCGEYGPQLMRPHYHACIFGYSFPDRKLWSIRDGVSLYRSELLEKCWPLGYSTVGDVTFESAAYVARYLMKKVTGDKALEHYRGIEPEYVCMSRRPGIGRDFFLKFKDDIYPDDFVLLKGKKLRPPKYYDKIYDDISPKKMLKIKGVRAARAVEHDEGLERLAVKEQVKIKQVKELKRNYEKNGI